ncbi:MAG: dTDP-4-dehydrorhamnose reductase [Bacteroidaceae bacterium]|nr:dTDP-4-dehydrorhamnose reductase [Bacteroidaceae bacterium]
MNILITGANGQLGSEMRRQSELHRQHRYFFTDVAELDICNQAAVNAFVRDNAIEVIVNCAAYTAVDKAEDNPELCDQLNHIAPCYLAEAAQAHGAALIQISTDYVFDGTAHLPYTEEQIPCPTSVYGRTKAACEHDILQICPQTMIIRTAWLYSIFGNNFVKTMIRLGREREQLGVVFDQIGTPTLAADLASIIYVAIDKGILPGIYHYSNEGVCSWYDFALAIHRLAGITTCHVRPLHTDEYPAKAPRPHYSVLDKTKIKQTYGISIPHWEESLAACINKLLTIDN